MLKLTKTNKDEKIIEDICQKLNQSINKITHTYPNFIYIGSKEKGYYNIYNKNIDGKNIDLSLHFRLYYPDKKSFLCNKKAIKGTNFNKYAEYNYKNSKLLYAKIEWFSVNPSGKGIGSKVIFNFINLLKNIEGVEFILLYPKDNKAKQFWTTNSFVDEDYSISLDRRVAVSACKRLIYKF